MTSHATKGSDIFIRALEKGAKRTWLDALHMSASDPKRTWEDRLTFKYLGSAALWYPAERSF
jgi:hypothetical protein